MVPDNLEQAIEQHVIKIMRRAGNNLSEAARRLGIHRRTLQRMIRRSKTLSREFPAPKRKARHVTATHD